MTPQLLAGVGVERNHVVAGRADKHLVAHLQRCGLVFSAGACGLGYVAGAKSPGHLQLAHVVHVDLIQRGKAVVVAAVAVMAPVLLLAGSIHGLACHGRLGLHLGVNLEHGHKGRHASHQHDRRCSKWQLAGRRLARLTSLTQQGHAGQHHHGSKGQGQQTRNQAPVIQTHFGQRPQHGRAESAQVEPCAAHAAANQLHAGQQQPQASEQKVPAAAQADELATAYQEEQAGKRQRRPQNPEPDARGQGLRLLPMCHIEPRTVCACTRTGIRLHSGTFEMRKKVHCCEK